MASTKIRTISEWFASASEDSFKTTFCSFSHNSKHFWTKWVTNSFFSANFALISKKWLWPLEYPFKCRNSTAFQCSTWHRSYRAIIRVSVHLVRARFADDSFPALKDVRTHYKFLKRSNFWKFSHVMMIVFCFKFFLVFFLMYSSAALGFYFSQ